MTFVRVTRGEPTDEELAALTAVLLALAAANRAAPPRPRRSSRADWGRVEHFRGYRSPISWMSAKAA